MQMLMAALTDTLLFGWLLFLSLSWWTTGARSPAGTLPSTDPGRVCFSGVNHRAAEAQLVLVGEARRSGPAEEYLWNKCGREGPLARQKQADVQGRVRGPRRNDIIPFLSPCVCEARGSACPRNIYPAIFPAT